MYLFDYQTNETKRTKKYFLSVSIIIIISTLFFDYSSCYCCCCVESCSCSINGWVENSVTHVFRRFVYKIQIMQSIGAWLVSLSNPVFRTTDPFPIINIIIIYDNDIIINQYNSNYYPICIDG